MNIRPFVRLANVSLVLAGVFVAPLGFAQRMNTDPAVEKSVAQLRADLEAGKTTSERLVRAYLDRIDALDRKGPAIRAVIAINPDALKIARELDRERKTTGARSPMHGVPVLLKDNIESLDALPTTAGSLALVENFAARDAPIVANLRAAGAVILGKTNLSEWANFRSERSISGWSAVGGLTKNPHVLDRSACGSSSGSGAAMAALFAPASVGTETDGSITCPASMNGIAGLKPTLGLLPQQGIVPIAHSQDTAGPMTRSALDAAIVLTAMAGDHSQCVREGCKRQDYAASLASHTLAGKRIGVWRFRAGRQPHIDPVLEKALQVLHDAGATLVEMPLPDMTRVGSAEETVLFTEFKADLNAYLSGMPARVKTRSLADLIAFNNNSTRELAVFGQDIFVRADGAKPLSDPEYRTAATEGKRLAGPEGIGRTLSTERLDFIVAPTNTPAWRVDIVSGDNFGGSFSTLPAVSGYPHLTVPMGAIQHLPVGISFIGPPWSEALLLGVAHDYEQRAKAAVIATFKRTLEMDDASALQPR
jgi:amidase